MYVYLRKLKKVKEPKGKRSKAKKKAVNPIVSGAVIRRFFLYSSPHPFQGDIPDLHSTTSFPEDDPDNMIESVFIDDANYMGSGDLNDLSAANIDDDIQVLTADDVNSVTYHLDMPQKSTATVSPQSVFKNPETGGLVYLQKLKKVKKPKKLKVKKSPGKGVPLKTFSRSGSSKD